MNNYDFSQLNPIEFENLVNDLLEKEYNVRIERFKEGRDQGIDGRFEYENGKIVIIQTKHYLKTGLDGLKQILEKKEKIKDGIKKETGELVKVEKLKKGGKLDKYVFATSVGLSPKNKKEIFDIFFGYIEKESDIFGPEDLNNILSKNKDIEEKHYKLWVSSANVLKIMLNNIINNDIIGRSADEIKKYIEKNKFFYITKDFNNAIDILNKSSVLIITGEPGIGKSTLSEQLCLKFISKGEFKFFKISKNINEAEKIWKDEEKQIFYFDDFLGSNYLEKIDGKDTEIKNFIDRIIRSKKNKNIEDKIFILNSRTTILKSGIENSAISGFREDIEENEFILKVKNLSEEEKAYILYNHLYYSDLEEKYTNKIYENKNYNTIIKHENYNPRLIEFITNKKRVNIDETKYINFIINNLDNPSEIWKNVFEKQSNDFINYLVHLTVFNGGKISENILKNKYNIFVKKINNGIIPIKNNFENTIKIALNNFLVRTNNNGAITYSLINPSITDYILHKNINDEDFLIDIFDDLGNCEGLRQLNNLYKNGVNKNPFVKNIVKINKDNYYKIIYGLYDKGLDNKDDIYKIVLFNLGNKKELHKILVNEVQKFIDDYININNDYISILFDLISQNYLNLNFKDSNFLIKYIEKIELDTLDFIYIGEIVDYIDSKNEVEEYNNSLLDLLEEKIKLCLEKDVEYIINDIEFDDYLNDGDDPMNINLDIIIEDIISSKLPDKLSDFISSYNVYQPISNIDFSNINISISDLKYRYEEYKDSINSENNFDYDGYKDIEKDKVSDTDFNEVDYIFSKK